MKKYFLFCIIALASCATVNAQKTQLEKKWSFNTAITMPAGKWESGLIQPLRLALGDRLELRCNALVLPLIPNAGIKKLWIRGHDFDFASEHVISWPSPFLNFVSRKGTGGLISPEFDFPFILTISNSGIATKHLQNGMLATATAGYVFAVRKSKPDILSTIDLPVFYPRMAHYYDGSTIKAGVALKGAFANQWFFEQSLQAFAVLRSENNFFAENSGTIMWAPGKSLRLRGGYVLTYGRYPFGKYWQIWPTFDLVFGSR